MPNFDPNTSLKRMNGFAAQHGGRLVSKNYVGSQAVYIWACQFGHKWQSTVMLIKAGRWCPLCGGVEPWTISTLRTFAKSKGGKLLSKVYEDGSQPVLWRCKNNHSWSATAYDVLNRISWCPSCSYLKLDTLRSGSIEECISVAERRSGQCLSTKYLDAHTNLEWKCAEGHRWSAPPMRIKAGYWCPVCAKKATAGQNRLSIEVFQKLAESKGGTLVSTTYKNIKTPMTWRCKYQHEWTAAPSSIKAGGWCRQCQIDARRLEKQKRP